MDRSIVMQGTESYETKCLYCIINSTYIFALAAFLDSRYPTHETGNEVTNAYIVNILS